MTLRDDELETAVEMSAALRRGEVASVELVERALARAEQWQPVTSAFSQLWPDEALAAARAVDRRPLGERAPLAGIPVAVKDLYDVAGRETTGCCAAYAGHVAVADAPTVRSVREAGLVLIGKTNQHQIAAGATNLISSCGPTANPWNPACMTGGSSGGAGAAVAAGVVPWGLGSDTGGSIRIPASLCGVFGLKPTTGSISIAGMLPHSPSLDCPGPLAGNTADTELLHRVLAGAALDAAARGGDDVRPEGARVGVASSGYFTDLVDPEALAATDGVARTLEAAGLAVDGFDAHGISDARRTWALVAYPELYAEHPLLRSRRDLVDPAVLSLLDYGRDLSDEDRALGRARRAEITHWFEEALEGRAALVVPTTPYPAPNSDDYVASLQRSDVAPAERMSPAWLTCPINVAGLPALNLPAAASRAGLPLGVSLVGRAGDEDTLLALAALWERASGFRSQRPPGLGA